MANTPASAAQPINVQFTPAQLGTMLVVDGLLLAMNVAVQQLGGFLKYEPAAQMVLHAQSVLVRDFEALKVQWQQKVVLAPASSLSVIEGKKVG